MEQERGFWSKISKVIIRVVISIIILVAGVVVFKGFSSQKKAPASEKAGVDEKTYAGIEIELKPVRAEVKVYGTVQSEATIAVSAETSGKISYKYRNMKPGTVVKRGDVLIKIDPKNYEIALKKAEAQIEQFKAKIATQQVEFDNSKPLLASVLRNYKLGEANYKRLKVLYEKGAASKIDFETAEKNLTELKSKLINAEAAIKNATYGLDSLKAQLDSALVAKEEAELNLKRCEIKAPISGRLINISANYGEYVSIGKSLFSIVDDSVLEIPVSLSTDEISMILDFRPGKDTDYNHWFKYDNSEKVIIEWRDNKGLVQWNGKIVSVEKFNLDTRTITVLVKPTGAVKMENDSFPLVTGLFCKVIFTGKVIKDGLKVPLSAVQINGCIYVVDKETGLSKEVPANIIRYDNYQAIISSKDLKAGDYLITQPLPHGLLNDTKVKIVKPITMQ